MNPAYVVALGLLVDIVGVFLLSVEAIKIHNIARLRDQVVGKLGVYFSSPLISTGEELRPLTSTDLDRGFDGRPFTYYAFHLASSSMLVLLAERARLGLGLGPDQWAVASLWQWQWQSIWRWPVFAGLLVLVLAVLPFIAGCWAHKLIERGSSALVAVLLEVERRTPAGGTGVLGFAILLSGFGLQLIGTPMSVG